MANKGFRRYYIQSPLSISDDAKREQETASLENINDTFKRVIIVRDDINPTTTTASISQACSTSS